MQGAAVVKNLKRRGQSPFALPRADKTETARLKFAAP